MTTSSKDLVERYKSGDLDDRGTYFNITSDQQKALMEFWKLLLPILKKDDVIKFVESETMGFGKSDETQNKKAKDPLYYQMVGDVCEKEALPPRCSENETTSFTCVFTRIAASLHPDSIVLKFLRARKWDVNKALNMFTEAMTWRGENNVDQLVWYGESNLNLRYMRKGVGYTTGVDRLGYHILYIDAQDLLPSEQSLKELLKNTVYIMEIAMRTISPEREKVTILIDVKNMGFKNFDWPFFKLFLKFLTDYYPESLSLVLIYSSSWVFKTLWATIKGLLDPVVAAKVQFVSTSEDIIQFIDKDQLIEKYGGTSKEKYEYILPIANENEKMHKTLEAERVSQEFKSAAFKFIDATADWTSSDDASRDSTKQLRNTAIETLLASGKQFEQYFTARNFYHRTGKLT